MVARCLPSKFRISIQSHLKTCTEAAMVVVRSAHEALLTCMLDMYALGLAFLATAKNKNMNYLGAGRREVVSEKVASINCHLSDYQLLGAGCAGSGGGGRAAGGGGLY